MVVKLNPLIPLAVNLADCRKRFLLFIGSGVSKDAGVPTGWDILIDTLGKIYSQEHNGQTLSYQDIEDWYKNERSLRNLGYSEILDFMCKGQEQKRQYLNDYFKDKEPGEAHRLIVKMVSMGLIRFIITTNFDTLLERALDAEGFHDKYSVLSTEDHIKSSDTWDKVEVCRIYKIHGDIKQGQIRNSLKELKSLGRLMGKEFQELIDRHGVIVVGYSGLDKGVMDCFEKREYHRYPIYWQYRENRTEQVKKLIARQDGEFIKCPRASQFFAELIHRVELIQRTSALENDVETTKRHYVRILQGKNNIQILNEIESERDRFLRMLRVTLEQVTGNWRDLWDANVKLIEACRDNIILSEQIMRFGLQAYWSNYIKIFEQIHKFNRHGETYGKNGLVNNLFYQLFLYTGSSVFYSENFVLVKNLLGLKKMLHDRMEEILEWNIRADFIEQKNKAEGTRSRASRFKYLLQLVKAGKFPDSSDERIKERIKNIIQFDFLCYMYKVRYSTRDSMSHLWFPYAMYYLDYGGLEFINRLALDVDFLRKIGTELFDFTEFDFKSFLSTLPEIYDQLQQNISGGWPRHNPFTILKKKFKEKSQV